MRPAPSDSDLLLGTLAIERGLVTQIQLEECLKIIETHAREGKEPVPRLGELLVLRGFMTAQEVDQTIHSGDMTVASVSWAASDFAPVEPGQKVDKYVLEARIGRGGMGEVWKARDTELGRVVALKFFRGTEEEEMQRFRREAQTAGKLNHPNIAAIYEARNDYIAMEFVDGATLAALPRNDVRRLVRVIRQTALALEHAHQEGVIHRDIKPGNVMVSSTGEEDRVFVMDFGIARSMSVERGITVSGIILGTPAYMSPEQATGRSTIDHRTDLFSLGSTLYELIGGRPAFKSDNIYEVLKQVIHDDPISLRKLRPGVDPELETIVLKCMDKVPDARYQSGKELAEDLRRWLDGEPILATRPSLMTRLRKTIRRHRIPSALVALLIVALAAGAAALLLQKREFALVIESQKALDAARLTLQKWKKERYGKPHDVTPARDRLQTAARSLEAALETEPDAHEIWSLLGWIRFELDQVDPARKAAEEAVRLAPERGLYRYRLGRILGAQFQRMHSRQHRFLGAELRMLRGEDAEPWRRRRDDAFRSALTATDWTGAEPWMRAWTEAMVLVADEKLQDAADRFSEIASENTFGGEEALLQLVSFTADGDKKVQYVLQAIEHARSWAVARRTLARITADRIFALTRAGDEHERIRGIFEPARVHADTGIRIDPASPLSWHARGALLSSWGNQLRTTGEDAGPALILAVKDYSRSLTLSPDKIEYLLDRANTRCQLGIVRMRQGLDPSPFFLAAIREDCDAATGLEPGAAYPLVIRGYARLQLASWEEISDRDPAPTLKEALKVDFESAVELEPDSHLGWHYIGVVRVNLAEQSRTRDMEIEQGLREAIEHDLPRAIRLAPDQHETLMTLGFARLLRIMRYGNASLDERKELEQARYEMNEAIRLAPGVRHHRIRRARVFLDWAQVAAGRGEDTKDLLRLVLEKDLDPLLRLDPDEHEALHLRAQCWFQMGQLVGGDGSDPSEMYEKSIRDSSAALKSGLFVFQGHFVRAAARFRWSYWRRRHGKDDSDLFRQALDDINEAIRLRPDSVRSLMEKGEMLRSRATFLARIQKDPEPLFRESIETMQRALKAAPSDAKVRWQLGMCWTNWGSWLQRNRRPCSDKFDKAVEAYENSIRIDADSHEAWKGLGVAHFNLANEARKQGGDPTRLIQKAIDEDFMRALRLDPKSGTTWRLLGSAAGTLAHWQGENGRTRESAISLKAALKALDQAVVFSPRDPESYVQRGFYLTVSGQPDKALKDYEKVLELNPALEPRIRKMVEDARKLKEDRDRR